MYTSREFKFLWTFSFLTHAELYVDGKEERCRATNHPDGICLKLTICAKRWRTTKGQNFLKFSHYQTLPASGSRRFNFVMQH